MASQKTARQHYVPQAFLRGFATADELSRNLIWLYEKLPNRKPRKISIRSVAWEKGYYAQEQEDGTEDLDTIEKGFASTVDQQAPDLISRLQSKSGVKIELSGEEKGLLAFFVGISMTRVPSFREPMRQYHTRIAEMTMERLAEIDANIREGIERWGICIEAKEWASLRPMMFVAQQLGESILQKQWQFYVPAAGMSLVTSDNPVVFSVGPRSKNPFMGPAHPMTEILMNLRSDLALVCTPKIGYPSGLVFQQSAHDTRKFNRGIVRAARRFVFADFYSETMDVFIKKYVGDEQTIRLD